MSSQELDYRGTPVDLKESETNTRQIRVLITGASGGIGQEIALKFAYNNKIGLHYNRNAASVERTREIISFSSGTSLPLPADVTKPEEITRAVEEFVQWAGGIDVLINNVGSMVRRCSIEEMDLDLWRETYQLNVESTFLFTKAAIPYMKKQAGGGSIINLTSIAAVTGGSSTASHYSSAKAAVSCFTLSAAKELAPYKIRVNAVAPGFIETPFHDSITDRSVLEAVKGQTPLQRLGTSVDVAEAVHFLTSKSASFITGTVLDVNGGLLMRS